MVRLPRCLSEALYSLQLRMRYVAFFFIARKAYHVTASATLHSDSCNKAHCLFKITTSGASFHITCAGHIRWNILFRLPVRFAPYPQATMADSHNSKLVARITKSFCSRHLPTRIVCGGRQQSTEASTPAPDNHGRTA